MERWHWLAELPAMSSTRAGLQLTANVCMHVNFLGQE